jgi:hypothetical protein
VADAKISDLPAAAALAAGDLFEVVDASDTTDGPDGSNKQATLAALKSFVTAPVTLLQAVGTVPQNQATGTYWWSFAGVTLIASGGNNTTPPAFIVLNPADWADVDDLDLHVSLVTTLAQTGVTFTFGLYPITLSGSTSPVWTFGSVVPGSTVAFTAPGTASENRGNSGSFAFPATNLYVFGLEISGAASPAGGRTHFVCTLRGTRS